MCPHTFAWIECSNLDALFKHLFSTFVFLDESFALSDESLACDWSACHVSRTRIQTCDQLHEEPFCLIQLVLRLHVSHCLHCESTQSVSELLCSAVSARNEQIRNSLNTWTHTSCWCLWWHQMWWRNIGTIFCGCSYSNKWIIGITLGFFLSVVASLSQTWWVLAFQQHNSNCSYQINVVAWKYKVTKK